MSAEKSEIIPTIDHKPHAAFFRQSGWLVISAVVGGFLAMVVHSLAKSKSISEGQYAAFGTLLTLVSCLPTMPLQMIFTQQTALALMSGRERQLSGMIRLVWFGLTFLWLPGAVAVFLFEKQIVAGWHLPDARGLWVTLWLILFSVWSPLFSGVLQGRQDFFWLGWSAILSGVARLGGAVVLVLALKFGSEGLMTGALIGVGLGTIITIWRSRDFWWLKVESFDWKKLLRQVMPLLFGFGACQFLFASDTMFAKAYFNDDQMAQYVAAGTLSRGLLWVVLPLAAVMFPKIVAGSTKAEKDKLFALVVMGTAILTICGGLGLWLVGPLVIKLWLGPAYLGAGALLPWYASAMVPLAMGNVLVNDLLARGRFAVVPFMVLLAVAYGVTLPLMLNHFPGRIEVVLQTLAAFNLLLFGVCAWFVWGKKSKA